MDNNSQDHGLDATHIQQVWNELADLLGQDWASALTSTNQAPASAQQPELGVALGVDEHPAQEVYPLDADQPAQRELTAAEEQPYQPLIPGPAGVDTQDQRPDFNALNGNGPLPPSVSDADSNFPDNQIPTFDSAQEQFNFNGTGSGFDWDFEHESNFVANLRASEARSVSETTSASPTNVDPAFTLVAVTSTESIAATTVSAVALSSGQTTPILAIPSSSNSPSSSGDLSGTVGLSPSTHLSSNVSSVDSMAQGPFQAVSHVNTLTVDQPNVAGFATPHQHADEDENPHIPNAIFNGSPDALQPAQSTTGNGNFPLGPSDPFAFLASYPYNGSTIAQDGSSTHFQSSNPVSHLPATETQFCGTKRRCDQSEEDDAFCHGKKARQDHPHEDGSVLNGGATSNEQDDNAEGSNTSKGKGKHCASSAEMSSWSAFPVQLSLPEDHNDNTGGNSSAVAPTLGSFMQDVPVSRRKANPLQAEGSLVARTCRMTLSGHRGASDFATNELTRRGQAAVFGSYALAHNNTEGSLPASSLLPSSSSSTGVTRGASESTQSRDEAPVLSTTLPAPEVSGAHASSPDIPLANPVVPPRVQGTDVPRTGSVVARAPSNKSSKASGKKPKPLLYNSAEFVKVDGAPLVERIRKNPIKKVDWPLYRGYPFYPDAPIPHRMITVKRSDVKRVSTPPTSETQPEEHELPQAGSIGNTVVHNTNDTPISPSVVPDDAPSTAPTVPPPPPAPTASTSSVSDANAVSISAVAVEHRLQLLPSMDQQELIREEHAALQRLRDVRAELDLRRCSRVQQSAPLPSNVDDVAQPQNTTEDNRSTQSEGKETSESNSSQNA